PWLVRCVGAASRSKTSARRRLLPGSGSAATVRSNLSLPPTSQRLKSRSAASSNCSPERRWSLTKTQKLGHGSSVSQFVEPEHGLNQRILLGSRHDRTCELAKLLDDLCFAGETLFAPARRVAALALE